MPRTVEINYFKLMGGVQLLMPTSGASTLARWHAEYVVGQRMGDHMQDIPHASTIPLVSTQAGTVSIAEMPVDFTKTVEQQMTELFDQIAEQEGLSRAKDDLPAVPKRKK